MSTPSIRLCGEDFGFLCFELGFGEDPGVSELAELLQLAEHVFRVGRSRRLRILDGRRRSLRCCCGLILGGLIFGSPSPLLAARDTSGDGGGGARDDDHDRTGLAYTDADRCWHRSRWQQLRGLRHAGIMRPQLSGL